MAVKRVDRTVSTEHGAAVGPPEVTRSVRDHAVNAPSAH
jgi:hypothetical protein